ncbi:MAG: hypothetical protein Q9173_002775 [Seirophora scorigena]
MATNPKDEREPSEHASLLSPPIRPVDSQAEPAEVSHKRPSQLWILTLLLLYVFFLDLGYEIIVPAQTRVFEAIYCKKYYKKHDASLIGSDGRDGIAEKWCKVGVIQGEVAMLKGWQITFDSIGSETLNVPNGSIDFLTRLMSLSTVLIFSIPWGYVADSYGRKPVILLLIHTALGGSVTVATALIYTTISDVTPEDKRATIFFQVVAASFITQFLGPLLSAALMERSPWIPMILGLAVELIAVGLISLIPETLNYGGSLAPESTSSSARSIMRTNLSGTWRSLPQLAHDSISFLFSDIRVVLILSTFVLHMLLQNRDVLLQYISTRYQTTLALATVYISIRSGLILLLCLIFLPATNLLFRRRFGSKRSDLLLSRASAALIALGFLMIGPHSSAPTARTEYKDVNRPGIRHEMNL